VQADAGGALAGDQLAHPGAAVTRRPLPLPPAAGWSGAGSCGRATAVAVGMPSPLRSSAVGCGRCAAAKDASHWRIHNNDFCDLLVPPGATADPDP
jgi:hypothetical protein